MMRTGVLLAGVAFLPCAHAQVAIGAFAGGAEDRIWQTELAHAGLLFEFRSKLVPSAAVRASVWYCPERDDYSESYMTVHEPVEYTWLAQTYRERVGSAGIAVDLKFPFENNACVGGYYKGTYLLAGLGYAQRWQSLELWQQDRDGAIDSDHVEKQISEPTLRAGFGGEWNFKWGGPFIEGLITVSAPGLGPPAFRFPGTAMLTVGYRFSFVKPEPEE